MLARGVSILLTDSSLAQAVFLYACTLVAELTSRKNRPLIPALAVSIWPLGSGSSEYFY